MWLQVDALWQKTPKKGHWYVPCTYINLATYQNLLLCLQLSSDKPSCWFTMRKKMEWGTVKKKVCWMQRHPNFARDFLTQDGRINQSDVTFFLVSHDSAFWLLTADKLQHFHLVLPVLSSLLTPHTHWPSGGSAHGRVESRPQRGKFSSAVALSCLSLFDFFWFLPPRVKAPPSLRRGDRLGPRQVRYQKWDRTVEWVWKGGDTTIASG